MNINTMRIMAFTTALCCAALAEAVTKSVMAMPANPTFALKKILKKIATTNDDIYLKDEINKLQSGTDFTEEELLSVCELAIKKTSFSETFFDTPEHTELQQIMKSLIAELKGYQIDSVGFASHCSGAFFYGHPTINANLVFKNNDGTACTRSFNLDYRTLGLQIELNYHFDMIFTIGGDFSRHSTRSPLQFHPGIYVAIGCGFPFQVGVTVLPFKKASGCMIIVHAGLGFNLTNLALVLGGGTMTPKKAD